VWEVGSWKEVAILEHNHSVWAFSFSPDAKFLVTSSIFEAKVWGVRSWNEIATFNWHKFSFSPDGKFLASVDRSDTVKVLETENWKEIAALRGHGEIVQRAEEVVFSPDGKFLASTIGNKSVKVWEVGSWMEVATIYKAWGNPIGNLIFSPDGKYLVWDSLKIMEVWEVGSWKQLPGLSNTQPVSVFSPDGKFLAVLEEGDMVIWEIKSVRSWKVAVTLEHKDVNVFVFSPDGKFLASGSADKTVKVWEVGSWREIATFSLEDEVLSVAFSPDGKFLASGGELGEVKVWGWGFQDSLIGEVLQDLEVLERWLERLPTP
jgi:WD40 repeat protein